MPFISSFYIISIDVLGPKIFFRSFASAADATANLNGISTLLVNDLSTFLINGRPTFMNGQKNLSNDLPNHIILDI